MPSDWCELFDRSFCKQIRDKVWELLPDSLVCRVSYIANELRIEIERRPITGAKALLGPLLPPRQIRGFNFMVPPIDSWEAQTWMDQGESLVGSIVGSIQEHLPAIIHELTHGQDDAASA